MSLEESPKQSKEYPKQSKYLLLRLKLNDQFDSNQWSLITKTNSDDFIKIQKYVLNKLVQNKKLFAKYFQLFFNNHVKILHWYMLAVKDKNEIDPYVFRQLLSKKINFYQQKQKNKSSHKNSHNQSQQDSQNVSFMRPSSNQITQMKQGVMNKFFEDLIDINQKQYKRKPLNLKIYQKQNNNLDSHQLYLRTFDACNGRKYVSYDYQKHMKGISQMYKYNSCLRGKQNNMKLAIKQSSCLNLQIFSQFSQFKAKTQRQKCALIPLNQILQKTKINSTAGFKNIIHKNQNSKLVFVNHQGKPITYYVRKSQKPTTSR